MSLIFLSNYLIGMAHTHKTYFKYFLSAKTAKSAKKIKKKQRERKFFPEIPDLSKRRGSTDS